MADPDSPVQLSRDDWSVILTRTGHEFRIHQAYDIAASLTYYAVLAIFPTVLAALALLGIFGSAESVANDVLRVIEDFGGSSVIDPLSEPIQQLLDANAAEGVMQFGRREVRERVGAQHAATAFIVGLVAALWATSGYVGTFGRGMNRIYEVEEGRPFWEMRPAMLGVGLKGLDGVSGLRVRQEGERRLRISITCDPDADPGPLISRLDREAVARVRRSVGLSAAPVLVRLHVRRRPATRP